MNLEVGQHDTVTYGRPHANEFLPEHVEVLLKSASRWRRVPNPWTPRAVYTSIIGVRACAADIAWPRDAEFVREDGSRVPTSELGMWKTAYGLRVEPRLAFVVMHGWRGPGGQGRLTVWFNRRAYVRGRNGALRCVDLWKKRARGRYHTKEELILKELAR